MSLTKISTSDAIMSTNLRYLILVNKVTFIALTAYINE